ncbi:MAG: type II toxin-antitoxin system HicA family toxin [Bacteroidetes bacterium]|nr:MAG: type II toxin-antitoxin system HicA family toxin [Bacteroidota bacterium]
MKMPRDLSGQEPVKYLKPYGYIITRQTGSHIRLTTQLKGEHHITVPNHDTLKIGTLSSILTDIALHLGTTKEVLSKELFV